MTDGPLQWYFLFGIIQNGIKMPVDLKFRPTLYQQLFYHTTEAEQYGARTERMNAWQEIESVEIIAAINKTRIHIVNMKAKLEPPDSSKSKRLLRRPYFDRLEEQELFGDFRSREYPFGYAWMLFPSPESLMTPDIKYYEGQVWSVKMIGGNFEIQYNLTKIDHQQHLAYVDGRKGVCLNGETGKRQWNATWIVDTRFGIIKQMQLELDTEQESPKMTTHKKISKLLKRVADEHTIFDYEVDDDHEDL